MIHEGPYDTFEMVVFKNWVSLNFTARGIGAILLSSKRIRGQEEANKAFTARWNEAVVDEEDGSNGLYIKRINKIEENQKNLNILKQYMGNRIYAEVR